jgi:hypothetical protein
VTGLPETKAKGWLLASWLGCAWLTLGLGLKNSPIPSVKEAFREPATPFDLTSSEAAKQWSFLEEAYARVPEGTSYTIRAENRDAEMMLFMLSRGLFVSQTVFPASYYGVPTSDLGLRARYVLVFGRCSLPSPGLRLLSQVSGGCIFENVGRD